MMIMCGRVIQSSAPFRLAIAKGLDVRDSRFHNYPSRWNGAPSQELLVIRRNHYTGELSLDPLRWGLIPYWCEDPKGGRKADQRQVRDGAHVADVPRRLSAAAVHRAGRRLLRVEGDQRSEGEAALRDRHEGRQPVWAWGVVGELERPGLGRVDRTFAIITTDANELVAEIHDRMPLIIAPGDYARWLGEEPDHGDLMRPFSADPMRMWPISTRVNKPEHDDPTIVEPIELSAA